MKSIRVKKTIGFIFQIVFILSFFSFIYYVIGDEIITELRFPLWETSQNIPTDKAIYLSSGIIDIRSGEPQLTKLLRYDEQTNQFDYYLIHFTNQINEDTYTKVQDTGAFCQRDLLLEMNTLLIGATLDQLNRIKALEEVDWVGRYHPAYKISSRFNMPLNGPKNVVIKTFPNLDQNQFAEIIDRIKGFNSIISAENVHLNEDYGYIFARIPLQNLIDIVRIKEVMFISPFNPQSSS